MGRRSVVVLAGVILWAAALPGALGGPGLRAEAAPGAPVLSGDSDSADGTDTGESGYAFAEDAHRIDGASDTADAERLDAGLTYRSALPEGGTAHYRLDLDATSTAYVSATAVPRPDSEVSSGEGIKVSLQDADGRTCSTGTTWFGATRSPHPVTAWAARDISAAAARTLCRGEGTFYVLVRRVALTDSPAPAAWDLDLTHVSEPPLRTAGATEAPEAWDSATPAPVAGEPVTREGGAGFASATEVGQGVWRAGITPGQTLYYRVPVGWGRQLAASMELGSTDSGDGAGFLGTALAMTLYNPVRGYVDDIGMGYDGTRRTVSLRPLPPVDHANRYAVSNRMSAMRFAGSYYLAVHLAAQTAEKFGDGPFGLTLRVRVGGEGRTPPAYAGPTRPEGVFDATATGEGNLGEGTPDGGGKGDGGADGTAEGADSGGTSASAGGMGGPGRSAVMRVVAASGIGGGTALLLALGTWKAVARRRARR